MYPINLVLTNRRCAVVGGGEVATRKILRLVEAGADVTIIAPTLTEKLTDMVKVNKVSWNKTTYSKGLLQDFFCVFCATDDAVVNRQAAAEARAAGALVNVASAPELCDFTVPGVVKRGSVTFAVSSDGASPAFVRLLRKDLERRYHEGFGEMAEFLQNLRQELIKSGDSSRTRELLWKQVLKEDIIQLILDKDLKRAKNEIRNSINCAGIKSSDSTR